MRLAIILTALVSLDRAVGQLHKLAQDAGLLYFGTAISPSDSSDAAYWKIANDINMFGQWTPDNAQKWESTEASRGRFSYSQADSLISKATSNKQIMRCHTLVWYSQLPGWGRLFS
jgi:endo-1,4-beta-xylanase